MFLATFPYRVRSFRLETEKASFWDEVAKTIVFYDDKLKRLVLGQLHGALCLNDDKCLKTHHF